MINGEHQLTGVSACRTQASCAGTGDEVVSTIAYDVTSTSAGAGDGSLTASRAMTYTAMGDVATVDEPLPGTADTARTRIAF